MSLTVALRCADLRGRALDAALHVDENAERAIDLDALRLRGALDVVREMR